MKTFRLLLLGIIVLIWNQHPAAAQTLQWARQFTGTQANVVAQIAADSSGIYVAGFTLGALPGEPSVISQQDGYLRKYDPSGTVLWTKEVASTINPFGQLVSVNGVAVDSTGVYVVGKTGNGTGYNAENGNVAVVNKFDANGNLLWRHQTTTSKTLLGESASGVALSGGAVYVVGESINLDPTNILNSFHAYVRKLDSSGNEIWTTLFNNVSGNSSAASPYGVSADATGAYIVGSTRGSLITPPAPPVAQLFTRKYDTSGNLLWTDQFGVTNSGDEAYAVSAGASGVYVVGTTFGLLGIQPLPTFDADAYVRKYDPSGNVQWTRQFGTAAKDEAFGALADDTGVYAVGYTQGVLGAASLGGTDAFVRRFDSNGNALFTIQTGSVNTDFGVGVASDAGGIYIGGYTIALPTSTFVKDSFLHKFSFPAPGGPVISTGGIVNNASFAPNPQPVAPGSIVAIFGTGLDDGSQVLSSAFDANGKLVTTLGGASVTVGGVSAPMFYSTSGQLGIQIPYEMAGQNTASVQVTVGGQLSQPATINLTAIRPGLFTVSQDGRGIAVCLHSDGVTPVTAANPAHPTEVVVLYGTGFGPLSTPLGTGQPSNGNLTSSTPTVTIDGLPAQVMFSGMAPGFVGLNQINVTIPGLARTNTADPLVVTIGNAQANAVTLPVGP